MDKTKKIDIVLRIIESLAFIVALFFSMRLFKLISCGYENTYLAVFCINTFAFALSALNAKKKNNRVLGYSVFKRIIGVKKNGKS